MDGVRETDHTSQCLRMAARPPTTDLSGGKASEDSFTTSTTTLAEAYAVDFQLDFDLSSFVAAFCSGVRSWHLKYSPSLVAGCVGSESVVLSALGGRTIR